MFFSFSVQKSSKLLAFACFVLILPSLIIGQETQHSVLKAHHVFKVHQGMSVNISCNYNKSDETERFHATLHLNKDHKLCSYVNNNTNNKTSMCQSCNKDIRFIWITESKEITFELSNLQINNSGTYRCIVRRDIPPPAMTIGENNTTVQVLACPHVSMSCMKEPDGHPIILCSSEGFYPSDLQQVWLRDGELMNISHTQNTIRNHSDGSFTLHSYLNLSSAISDSLNYSCGVNHSSLNKQVVLHLSLANCTDRKTEPSLHISYNMKIALMISALLTLIILIMAVVLKHFRKNNNRSPVSPIHFNAQSELVYSMLGDHRPVPCSNRPNQTTPPSTLNTD
ncbi:uncharacterized protein [Misgurnus anguillicaudatus]|uniref:uncharacterized protein n=1 Tax=Misgurnus anguillicaudatus TaxID=75329 RepID=UPI003CCFB656